MGETGQRRLAAVLVVLAAAAAAAHGLWVGTVNDDAGISLAYARTLAQGEGLRLTPWSQRVEAFSNPLWTLWLALGFRAGLAQGDGAAFAHATGALLGGLACLPLGLVLARARGRRLRPADALAPWVLALDTTYADWIGSGLETGAFALALAWGLCLLAGEFPRTRGKREEAPGPRASRAWSALPFGLLALLRPEGPLYALGAWLARLWLLRRARRQDGPSPADRGAEAAWMVVAALPLLSWLVLRFHYYGREVPNSYTLKITWDFLDPAAYLHRWWDSNPGVHRWLWLAPLPLLVGETRRAAWLALLAGLLPALAFVRWSGGDWMSGHRFLGHALPAVALLTALVPIALGQAAGWIPFLGGLRTMVRAVEGDGAPATPPEGGLLAAVVATGLRGARTAALTTLVASAALLGLAAFAAARASPERRAHPDNPLSWVHEQARWFRAEADRRGLLRPRVAHYDIGAMALDTGGEVVDLAGLADLRMARVSHKKGAQAADYVFDEAKPDLLNLHGPCAYLEADPRLARDYQVAARGAWGTNYLRRSLAGDDDDRCPGGLAALRALEAAGPQALLAALRADGEAGRWDDARWRWLCARGRWPRALLPVGEAEALGREWERRALAEPSPAIPALRAAAALAPSAVQAALRLEALRR